MATTSLYNNTAIYPQRPASPSLIAPSLQNIHLLLSVVESSVSANQNRAFSDIL